MRCLKLSRGIISFLQSEIFFGGGRHWVQKVTARNKLGGLGGMGKQFSALMSHFWNGIEP